MSFAKFKYDSEIIEILESKDTNLERVLKIAEVTGGLALPDYLIQFIHRTLPNKDQSIFIRQPISIQNYKDADHEKIVRKKGLMGQLGRDNAGALHNFGIFFNDLGMARVFYKFDGSIQFIKNIKND